MTYNITCTYCQKQYPVDERMVGKRAKCKKCGEVFIVPPPAPSGGADEAIDLSTFDDVEPAAGAYAPPPVAAPRPAARPVYASPPTYSPPPPSSGGWSYAGRRAWWSVPVILLVVGVRVYFVFAHHWSSSSGGWDTTSAQNMTLDQKRDQTAANLRLLGPALRSAAHDPSAKGNYNWHRTIKLNGLVPNSALVSPFGNGTIVGSDYDFRHVDAFDRPDKQNTIVLYDKYELNFNDGTTVYRANGAVEHLSHEDFDRQCRSDDGLPPIVSQAPQFPQMRFPQPFPPALMQPNVPRPGNPQPIAPPPNPVDDWAVNSKRGDTLSILGQIYSHTRMYPGTAKDELPPSLDIPIGNGMMIKDSERHSPFGAPGSKGDYAYHRYGAMTWPAPRAVIIAYDQAEHSADNQTAVLHANGQIELIKNSDFDAAMAASDKAAAAAEENHRLGKVNAPDPIPADQRQSDPPIPDHAWSAEPDPPATPVQINPHLRLLFPGACDFYFPSQPSAYMFLHQSVGAGDRRHPGTDGLWNLKTAAKVSSIPVIHALADEMASPDGKYFVGRVMGGKGQATVFEVWSTRTGKLLQTLSGPPVIGREMPESIGFLDGDQLLTRGDQFEVWDLKTGTRLRQFGDSSVVPTYAMSAISANGKLLALVSEDRQTIMLLDTSSGKLLGQSPIPDKQARQYEYGTYVYELQFSPDGQHLAVLLNGARIYVWHVADGHLEGRFAIQPPVDRNNIRKGDGPADTMAWLPDSEGWLLGGDRVVDRVTGAVIYQMPNFTEQNAREYSRRQVIDDNHVMLGFRAQLGFKTALETLTFDSAQLKKTRAVVRAATQPATQMQ